MVLNQSLTVRLPMFILYLLVTLMEVLAFLIGIGLTDSVCIQAHEIASATALYLMFVACPIIPNIFYMIGVFLLPLLCSHPMSSIYNIAMGTMCIVGGVILMSSLTKCGNEAQDTISIAAVFGIIAGIFHICNAAYIHSLLPWDETYLMKRV